MRIPSNSGSFGYPVLQKERYGYINDSNFQFSLTRNYASEFVSDYLVYNLEYSVKSDYLNELLVKNKAEIILHIEQKSYRQIFYLKDISTKLMLKKNHFTPDHKITILPLIVCMDNINYKNPINETQESYHKVNLWKLHKGSVLAIGDEYTIAVNQEPASFKSILNLQLDKKLNSNYKFRFFANEIVIYTSKEFYKELIKSKMKSKLTNLFLLSQALTQACILMLADKEFDPNSDLNVLNQFIVDQIKLNGEKIRESDIGLDTNLLIERATFFSNLILNEKTIDALKEQQFISFEKGEKNE